MIIKEIKKTKKDYLITFDNDETLKVSEDVIVKFRLIPGKTIHDISMIEDEINLSKIYDKAIRFASYGKSENQMRIYLENEGLLNTDELILRLKKDRIINDIQFINQLKRKDYGYLKLEEKLRYYHFDEVDIKHALDTYDDSFALNKAYKLALKKYSKELTHKKKEKIYRYLLSQGFFEEKVKSIMNVIE